MRYRHEPDNKGGKQAIAILRIDGVCERMIDGARTRLRDRVRPGSVLEAEVEVRWPEKPGDYLLVVDLVQENVAWFADRTGSPLAQGRVRVREP